MNHLSSEIGNANVSITDVNDIILVKHTILVGIKDCYIKYAIDIHVNYDNILAIDGQGTSDLGRTVFIEVNKIDAYKVNFGFGLRSGLRSGSGMRRLRSGLLNCLFVPSLGVGSHVFSRRVSYFLLLVMNIISYYGSSSTDSGTTDQSGTNGSGNFGSHMVIGFTLSALCGLRYTVHILVGLNKPGFVISIHSTV